MKTALAVAGALFISAVAWQWLNAPRGPEATLQPAGELRRQVDGTVRAGGRLLKERDTARAPASTADARARELEEAFRAEPVDGGWATAAEKSVRTAFERRTSDVRPSTVECRSDSCRLGFSKPTGGVKGDIALALAEAELGAWVMDSRNPDAIVVFAAR